MILFDAADSAADRSVALHALYAGISQDAMVPLNFQFVDLAVQIDHYKDQDIFRPALHKIGRASCRERV